VYTAYPILNYQKYPTSASYSTTRNTKHLFRHQLCMQTQNAVYMQTLTKKSYQVTLHCTQTFRVPVNSSQVTSSLSRFCTRVTSSPCDDFTLWRLHCDEFTVWRLHCDKFTFV